jgi:transglutaminase-like putative cysteine protease
MQFLLLVITMSGYSCPDALFIEHTASITALPDSGYVEISREVIVPLTGRGVERYRVISITHRSGWESIEILEAYVAHWRPGRSSQSASITERPHSTLLTDGRLETSLRETLVNFPGLEKGDTLFLEVSRTIDSLPLADFYSYSFYSGGRDSVASSSLTVEWPVNRTLLVEYSETVFAGPAVRFQDGARISTWSAGPASSAPSHYLAPPVSETTDRITISSSSPEEVSLGFHKVLDVVPVDEASCAIADSILEQTGSDPENIRRWVAAEIAYLGTDWGEYPGYSPRSPIETLESRSGVCRDNALMLVWLLRRAGWDASLVLTNTNGLPDPLVGSRSFNHLLVGVELPEGELSLLDPTATDVSEGVGSGLRGRRFLALTDPGSILERFPDPLYGDSLLILFNGILDSAEETIFGELELRATGAVDEIFRSMLLRTEPERRSELLDVLTGAIPGSGIWQIPDPAPNHERLVISGNAGWSTPILQLHEGTAVSIPGLKEFSLLGTRIAAYLLPEELSNHGIRISSPMFERLEATITGFDGSPAIPEPFHSGAYSLLITSCVDTLRIFEECRLLPSNPDSVTLSAILTGLDARCEQWRKVVVFR